MVDVTHANWQYGLFHGVENDASAGLDLGLPLCICQLIALLGEKQLLCIVRHKENCCGLLNCLYCLFVTHD